MHLRVMCFMTTSALTNKFTLHYNRFIRIPAFFALFSGFFFYHNGCVKLFLSDFHFASCRQCWTWMSSIYVSLWLDNMVVIAVNISSGIVLLSSLLIRKLNLARRYGTLICEPMCDSVWWVLGPWMRDCGDHEHLFTTASLWLTMCEFAKSLSDPNMWTAMNLFRKWYAADDLTGSLFV